MKLKLKERKSTINQNKENLCVYSALRDEILQVETLQMNYTICMYTLFFTAFSFSFQFEILRVVSLLILVTFQSLVNYSAWLSQKVSTYICVFFEYSRNDIHWESLHGKTDFRMLESKKKKTLSLWIANHAAGVLSIMTSVIDIYFEIVKLYNNSGGFGILIGWSSIISIGKITLTILLCVGVLVVTSQFETSDDRIKVTIKNYKNSLSR